MTDTLPRAPATMVSLFATALLLGSATGTAGASASLGSGHLVGYVGAAGLVMAVLGVVVVRAQVRWP